MSKIKINQPILDMYGSQLEREKLRKTESEPKEMELLTLRSVCMMNLLIPKNTIYGAQGNVIIVGDTDKEKFEKWDLYKKFRDAVEGEVNLSPEEVILLTKIVAENEVQLIAGQVRDMIS